MSKNLNAIDTSNSLWLFEDVARSQQSDSAYSKPNPKIRKKKKQNAKNIVLPHSRAKLTLYSRYLEQYLAILSVVKIVDKIHIFDIFCGTGIYNDGRFGSPILAFNNINKVDESLKKSHKINVNETVLYINDKKDTNVKNVQQYLSNQDKIPQLDIKYSNLDAQEMLEKVLDLVNKQSYKERNLIFLDPYGYSQIKKETIVKLMKTKKVEIILFLPTSLMHRFKDVVQQEERKAYEALRSFIYDFFDISHPIRVNENPVDKISIFDFINYLCEAFSMKGLCYSTSFYLQRDAANYYALFFLTSNILGLERVVDTKWKIDQTGGKGFILENSQHSFFKEDADKKAYNDILLYLEKIIVDKIAYNSNITNCDLYYTTVNSNFRPTHAVSVLKKLQNENIIVVTKIDGQRAKKGAFYIDYKYYSKEEIVVTFSLTNNHGRI